MKWCVTRVCADGDRVIAVGRKGMSPQELHKVLCMEDADYRASRYKPHFSPRKPKRQRSRLYSTPKLLDSCIVWQLESQ